MKQQTWTITFEEGDDWSSLTEESRRLIETAIHASTLAYAPYSNFKVGAALMTTSDEIIFGSNQENAAYPMCNCAEQVTVQKAFSEHPKTKIKLFAIYASGGNSHRPPAPCGACRQVLLESSQRSATDFPVILVGANRSYRIFSSVHDLLPFGFSPDDLV